MHLSDSLLAQIEAHKEAGEHEQALKLVNRILAKDPSHEDALLQIADIQYRQGELDKAAKAIDFLNTQKKHQDPMALYVKGVLEMEKTNWQEGRVYLKQAVKLTDFQNHEILRCYGLCEYWYGNREKGLGYVQESFAINNLDAEVIYNLIELYLLEHSYAKAQKLIRYYYRHQDELITFDKDISYYDHKITLFATFVKNYKQLVRVD